MTKIVLSILFFAIAPILLIFSALFYLYLTHHNGKTQLFTANNNGQAVSYAAIPTADNTFRYRVESADSRIEAVRDFFVRYNSPLAPYAEHIVASADAYQIDYKLLPSIAMQESNVCKKAPKDSYNCWGFGIYGKKMTTFENYPQAIETVSKVLARDYVRKGLVLPKEIMTKYTPSSNGSWANSVSFFMNSLEISL